MQFIRAAFCAALLVLSGRLPGVAQDVTLMSRDGVVEISGTLLGFDGEFYRVDTIFGELTVDGSGVRCDGPGCPNLQDYVAEVHVSGSATMGTVLVPALLAGYARRNGFAMQRDDRDATHVSYWLTELESKKRVAVFRFRVTNSDEGFADLLANEADLVMSLREITVEEQARAEDAGLGDLTDPYRAGVLALDAIVPIVSPQNPVREISPLQLAQVYSGKITNWSALGGPDVLIARHVPSERTGLGQAVRAQILERVDLTPSQDVIQHERGDDLTAAVLKDPFAMGLASFAEVGEAQPLALRGICGRVLQATRRAIKTEDYPLTAPMFIYTPARRLPRIARGFLTFLRGPTAQVIIRRTGFVDQAREEVSVDLQGDRFANAIAAAGAEIPLAELKRLVTRLVEMKRLTLSFRFEAGSVQLDAQSRSNVVQLARDLEQGLYDARQLFFLGFSDGEGPAPQNQRIATARAEAVRDAVLATAETMDPTQVKVGVDAFGEAMPLACDDSAWGRKANRRVEVWVR
ncbi:MAG: phosphate ABC transporter substrate-binding/OmpA family protein [Roseobacter sp.]